MKHHSLGSILKSLGFSTCSGNNSLFLALPKFCMSYLEDLVVLQEFLATHSSHSRNNSISLKRPPEMANTVDTKHLAGR